MSESQLIEYKESWRDEYLKWICASFACRNSLSKTRSGLRRFAVLKMLREVCFILVSEMTVLFVALLIQRNSWKIFRIHIRSRCVRMWRCAWIDC